MEFFSSMELFFVDTNFGCLHSSLVSQKAISMRGAAIANAELKTMVVTGTVESMDTV